MCPEKHDSFIATIRVHYFFVSKIYGTQRQLQTLHDLLELRLAHARLEPAHEVRELITSADTIGTQRSQLTKPRRESKRSPSIFRNCVLIKTFSNQIS